MNSVSKFLYWADASDKIGGVAGFWGVITSLVVVVGTIVWFIMLCMATAEGDVDKQEYRIFMRSYQKLLSLIAVVWIISGTAYVSRANRPSTPSRRPKWASR